MCFKCYRFVFFVFVRVSFLNHTVLECTKMSQYERGDRFSDKTSAHSPLSCVSMKSSNSMIQPPVFSTEEVTSNFRFEFYYWNPQMVNYNMNYCSVFVIWAGMRRHPQNPAVCPWRVTTISGDLCWSTQTILLLLIFKLYYNLFLSIIVIAVLISLGVDCVSSSF